MGPIDLHEEAGRAAFGELPKPLAEVDNYVLSVVRIQGSLGWHTHDDADELLYVLEGRLRVETETGIDHLGPGQLMVVPKDVARHPVADPEAVILLWERRGAAFPRKLDPRP